MQKTGYSRRILTNAIKSLDAKGLITITGRRGNSLETSRARGGFWLYFSYKYVHFTTQRSALLGREEVYCSAHNKTNKTKLTSTKLNETSVRLVSVGDVIGKMALVRE